MDDACRVSIRLFLCDPEGGTRDRTGEVVDLNAVEVCKTDLDLILSRALDVE